MAAAGDIIKGFTLVRQLGAGGMGETWEAVRHVGDDFEQRVAIKVVHRRALETAEGLQLFWREASLAASLRHPAIAAVHDCDERAGSIVCELVDGADLRAVLRVSPGLRLRPALLVYLMGQIARGLSHAHRRLLHGQLSPVVHRDMSPANVVVDYDGNMKIVDFGIAKAIASADVSETIKGKLSYMAPEQAMATRIDGRADQYALGVIAYEAASGVRPNDGMHDGETLANILSGKHLPVLTRVPYMPVELAEVIERMISLQPDQRFPSMDALITALDPFTPPLSIHRDFALLVQRAHPVQTIVRVSGRYISQPVAAEPLREATPVSSPSALSPIRNTPHTPQPRPPQSRTSHAPHTFNVTDGKVEFSDEPVSPHAETAAAVRAGAPHRTDTFVSQGSGRTPRELLAAPRDLLATPQPRSRVGRQAWLAGVAAVMLGLASWAIVNSDSHSANPPAVLPSPTPDQALKPILPAPTAPRPQPPAAASVAAPSGAADSLAGYPRDGTAYSGATSPTSDRPTDADVDNKLASNRRTGTRGKSEEDKPRDSRDSRDSRDAMASLDSPRRSPSEARAARAAEHAKSLESDRSERGDRPEREPSARTPSAKAGGANVRVSVFPWGRVWVDGKLRGSVPPILELSLSPGAHDIAVGHERPVESRSVTLETATTQNVAFDLEGR